MNKQVVIDFENIIKRYKVLKFDKIWEKTDTSYKLIYNLEGLSIDNRFYSNVKIIFWLDNKKEKLVENVITYLYTLSCDYKTITITSIEETFNAILQLLDKEETNKALSDFIINGTDNFNKELKVNSSEAFIQNLNYIPQGNKPCIKSNFKFELISNEETFTFYLKCLKNKWELTYETTVEEIALKDVYKKLIKLIYEIDRNNV